MDIRAAIELLLRKINTRGRPSGGLFGGMSGTVGSISMLQRDVNQAILQWQESEDTTGLIQMTSTLHAYGSLTDMEYADIMKVLDGDN